jgi:hypothetical protein
MVSTTVGWEALRHDHRVAAAVDRLGAQPNWAGQRVRVWAISVGQPSWWRTIASCAPPSVTSSGVTSQARQVNTSTNEVCAAVALDRVIQRSARRVSDNLPLTCPLPEMPPPVVAAV